MELQAKLTLQDFFRKFNQRYFLTLSSAVALSLALYASPVVAFANKEMAVSYIEGRQFERAIKEIEAIHAEGQADSETFLLLARIYIQTGAGIAAEAAVDRARRMGADYAQTAVPFAKAQLLQGKFAEAIGALRGVNIPAGSRAEAYVIAGDANFAMRKYVEARRNYELGRAADEKNFQAYLGLARLGLQSEHLEDAAKYAAKAAEMAPNNTMVRYTEGLIARYQGNGEAAERYFLEAQKLFPENILANIELAAIRIDQNRLEEAQSYLDLVYELAPKHPMAMYLSGTILAGRGQYDEANALLNAARVVTENYLPAVYIRGLVAYQLGEFSVAEGLLEKVLQARPANLPARMALASSYVKQGRPQAALNLLRPAISARPDAANLIAIAATAAMRMGDTAQGDALYQRLAELTGKDAAPNDIDMMAKLALAKFVSGHKEEALSTLANAVANTSANLRSLAILAGMQLRENDLPGAEETIIKMLRTAPDRALGYNMKGALEFKKGQYQLAKQSYAAAFSRNPEYYTALRNQALAQMQLQEWDEVEDVLKKLLELSPNDARAKAMLGRVLLRLGKADEAVDYFNAAVRAIPNSVDVWADYSEALAKAGNTAEAITQAKDTAVMAADRPDLLKRMGLLLLDIGEARLAVRSLSRYVAFNPDSGEAHLLQGRGMLAVGLYTGAKTAFQRAQAAAKDKPDPATLAWYLFAADALAERFDTALLYREDLIAAKRPEDVRPSIVGDLLLAAGRASAAVEAYRQAMKEEKSGYLYIGLARAQEVLGQRQQALLTLEEFVADNPTHRGGRLILGGKYSSEGRVEAAIRQYEAILKTGVADAEVAALLAKGYLEVGNRKSVPLIERAYLIRPEDPFILDAYGWILLQANRDTSNSIPALEKAIRRAPAIALYRYHLGMAYLAKGRREDAKAAFEQALRLDPDFSEASDAKRQLSAID